jgi:hypothetical protein
MKKLLIAFMVFASSPAFAEGLKYVPKWHMTGNEACYDIQGAKTLLKLDADMEECAGERQLAIAEVEKLKAANLDLTHALELTQKGEDLLKTRETGLTKDLKDCVAAKNKAEASQLPSMGWPIAGSVLLIGVGIILGHYLIK